MAWSFKLTEDGKIAVSKDADVIDLITPDEARRLGQSLITLSEDAERGRITSRTKAWYHGCWTQAGHYLWHVGGHHVHTDDNCPVYRMAGLDGGWAPREAGVRVFFAMQYSDAMQRRRMFDHGSECPQGQFLIHRLPARGVSLMAWWDRTHGDKRFACNSVYIVEGEPAVSDMLTWWPKHFPLQAKHLDGAGVRLIEVIADAV